MKKTIFLSKILLNSLEWWVLYFLPQSLNPVWVLPSAWAQIILPVTEAIKIESASIPILELVWFSPKPFKMIVVTQKWFCRGGGIIWWKRQWVIPGPVTTQGWRERWEDTGALLKVQLQVMVLENYLPLSDVAFWHTQKRNWIVLWINWLICNKCYFVIHHIEQVS